MTEEKSLIVVGERGLVIESHADLFRFAESAAKSGLGIPKALQGKTNDVFVMMAYGMEMGMLPMTAVQSFDVVHGVITIPGKEALKQINKSKDKEYFRYGYEGEGDEYHCWTESKRKGQEAHPKVTFSITQAKQAGLYDPKYRDRNGQASVWVKYTDDMLLWKCVAREWKRYWSYLLRAPLEVSEDLIEEPEVRDITPARAAVVTADPDVVQPVADGLLSGALQEMDVGPPKDLTSAEAEVPDAASVTEASAEVKDEDPPAEADLTHDCREWDPKSVDQDGEGHVFCDYQAGHKGRHSWEDRPEAGFGEPQNQEESDLQAAQNARDAAPPDPPAAEPDPPATDTPAEENVDPGASSAAPEPDPSLISQEERNKLWEAAQKRCQKFAGLNMIKVEEVSECALDVLTLVLKGKGYTVVEGTPTPIRKEDYRSISSRITNAKCPGHWIGRPQGEDNERAF